jgi:hypothetical protein
MKTIFGLMMLFVASSAFANVAIECGTQVNRNDGTVGKRSFLISSEDGRTYKAYDSADRPIRNSKIQQGPNQSLMLTIVMDQGLGGPVGVRFVIENYRGQNFIIASKYALGGFAGGSKVGELNCTVSEM